MFPCVPDTTNELTVISGADLFIPIDNGHLFAKNNSSFCLEISTVYGDNVHCSYSTRGVPYTEGIVEFDTEWFRFESVKPEYFLQISLVDLRNYTTGYGISPQIYGILKIPVERLNENTVQITGCLSYCTALLMLCMFLD